MEGGVRDAEGRDRPTVEPAKKNARQSGRTTGTPSSTTDARLSPSAARLFALQRSAGNRATGAALRRARTLPLQRAAPAATGEQLAFAPKDLVEERGEAEPEREKPPGLEAAGAAPAGAGGEPTPPDGGPPAAAAGDGGTAAPPPPSDGAPTGAAAPAASGAPAGASDGNPTASPSGPEKGAAAGSAQGSVAAGPGGRAAPGPSPAPPGEQLEAAGADKAPGTAKAAGLEQALKKAAPPVAALPPRPPVNPAARASTSVSGPPAPPSPKQAPPRIDAATQPTDLLQVAAPKPTVATGPLIVPALAAAQPMPVSRVPDAGGGGGPTPAAPTSGDAPVWGTWTLEELLNGGRTALELSRFIPMYGIIGGLAADGIGAYQDITAIPPGEYPITTSLVVLRSGINVANNVVGHLMYVGTLIQDGLAGSVVGAEFVPVSAAAMETFAGVKVGLDIGLFYADLGVEIGALWNQSHSGPEQWAAWQGIVDGYQANLMGDVVGMVLDTITLSNAGAANVDTIKAGTGIFNTAAILAQNWGGTLVAFLQGMFNVWGSKAPLVGGEQVPIGTRPPPAPAGAVPAQRLGEGAGATAEAAAMRGAAAFLNLQASQGRIAWEVVDAGIGALQAEAAKKMAELDAMVVQLSGGKNLFQVIQEGAMSALGAMRSKLETLEQMQQSATDAETNGAEVKGWAEDVLAKIDAFTVPDVTASASDFGDGMLADAAEFLADNAGALAASVLNAAIAEVRVAVDDVKAELRTPVEAVRDTAVEIGEFLAIVARVSGEQTAAIRGYIQNFEEGLGQCTGFEDAVNLIIRQITQLLGVPSFNVQDIRDFWRSLPGNFDQLDALATRLVARAVVLEREASLQTFPEMAAPAPDPEDEDPKGS